MESAVNHPEIDWQCTLTTSLYSQIEFLKDELRERNVTIACLLDLVKSIDSRNVVARDAVLPCAKENEASVINARINRSNSIPSINEITANDVAPWRKVIKKTSKLKVNDGTVLKNQFSVLSVPDDDVAANNSVPEVFMLNDENITMRRRGRKGEKKSRDSIFPNKHPENDIPRKSCPGNSKYSDIV